jgi:hypothetical protein
MEWREALKGVNYDGGVTMRKEGRFLFGQFYTLCGLQTAFIIPRNEKTMRSNPGFSEEGGRAREQ